MGTGSVGSVFGRIRFIEKPGVQDEGFAMWLNVVLNDRRIAYSEVKVQVRDLVRVVGIVVPFASRGLLSRENSFYGAPGGK